MEAYCVSCKKYNANENSKIQNLEKLNKID